MSEARCPDSLAAALGALGRSLWPEIARRYAEPHRHYHDLEHVGELADWFAAVRDGPGWRQPAEIALAILFHDAVYEPDRRDNEERSAQLASQLLSGASVDATRVAALIELTARHGGDVGDLRADPDAAHFLDADMAILGAPDERFDRYEREVRDEYVARIPKLLFAAGRRRFLWSLRGKEIFLTPFFRDRLADQAQRNIERALAT